MVSHSPISTGATPITVQETPKKEAGEKEESSAQKKTPQLQAASGSSESSGLCSPNLGVLASMTTQNKHFIKFLVGKLTGTQ